MWVWCAEQNRPSNSCSFETAYLLTSHPTYLAPSLSSASSHLLLSLPPLTLAVANLLGEAIWRVYNATSVAAIRE
jgi:hypothetical protein